jgi:uncharacterized OB-fold protein
MSDFYLNAGLPKPVAAPDGLDAPYWQGLQEGKLLLQRCSSCEKFQWGPEWICHRCHSFELEYQEVNPSGTIYSHERVWHPVHPALTDQGPYIVVLIELSQADNVRMVGNLLGDPQQEISIGSEVTAVFEHHVDDPKFTLLHWKLA